MKNRKLNRLKGWDYSSEGQYFVTICTSDRGDILGKIVDGKIELNEYGLIAERFLKNIPNVYKNVLIGEYIVMPDHIHGIIVIVGTGQCPVQKKENNENIKRTGQCPVRTIDEENKYGLLSKIINGYKNVVTKEIRKNLLLCHFKWHRSFYDEIIKSEEMLDKVRNYIKNNPQNK